MPPKNGGDLVLVVDDSPDTLRMLTDALEDAGMTVLVALEGRQALAIGEKITPDIILLDAIMPSIDGFETCRRLKRDKALAHVPVIFMTGLSDTEDIVKGLEAGGVDYVTKPIVHNELLARIRVHLANARLAHSARVALDASGRHLLATDASGRVLWSTPQASKLLEDTFSDFHGEGYMLPPAVKNWLERWTRSRVKPMPDEITLEPNSSARKLRLSHVGQLAPNEVLLRLIEGGIDNDNLVLEAKLQVTPRESEVLMWVARGKSNRDIAEILKLSPRTVNKHLEQIYSKLGVENRASAAALAVRTLGVG
ncbi:MAG: response regulator transcription factor [Bradyrhizobiaceae bacterium]|nr:response regulator transcription factor [Bradyrhizobiaceae bacterium]